MTSIVRAMIGEMGDCRGLLALSIVALLASVLTNLAGC